MAKKILVLGATSTIAVETCKIWTQQGHELCLIARNENKLNAVAQDLRVRHNAKLSTYNADLSDISQQQAVLNFAINNLEHIDIVLIAYGSLPQQEACETDIDKTIDEINNNGLSVIAWLTILANFLEQQQSGIIGVITSVAGDRGRASNYVYGCAKGMVSIFLSGLRARLFQSGVNVLDIRPGFVDTAMTKDFKKGLLWAKPEKVAMGIVKAFDKNKTVVYLPWFWQAIMGIIKIIPGFIFKK
ncbi:MAG: SDR family oxidoreductase, partial [Pseudomonadota bacterium]